MSDSDQKKGWTMCGVFGHALIGLAGALGSGIGDFLFTHVVNQIDVDTGCLSEPHFVVDN